MSSLRDDSTGLSAEQEQAILCLLNEPNVAKAAEKANVTERTVYRWLNEPVFGNTYRKARREAFCHAIGLSQKYASMAINVLLKVMADANAKDSAKVAAANSLLKFGREGIELDDLAVRIEALEQAANATKRN